MVFLSLPTSLFCAMNLRSADFLYSSSRQSSPDSLRSAPMDESDSDSDGSAGAMYEEGDRYPLEGKFMNAADKAEIMALPEIKREELLAERAQEVERYHQNRALRQLLNAREAETRKQDKKRKAGTADLEESHRKTSRQRTKVGGGKVGESSSGIDNLKRARAEKDDRQRRRREDNERNKDRRTYGHDDYSDGDVDADSEVEWDDHRAKRSPSSDDRGSEPATFIDVERIRVGRSRFALVCFYPGFDEAITGCYTRISVGKDPDNGQNVYRMAVVKGQYSHFHFTCSDTNKSKGFTEGKPYAMENANGKHFVTNQYARCAHGKAERDWPFIMCSDSPFTEVIFTTFIQSYILLTSAV
jgi:RNA polymerase-associated protein RTF1